MKRALFVTVGTIAGLTATLRYTPENPLLTAGTDLALGGSQSLGGTQSQAPAVKSSPKVPQVSDSKSAKPAATKSAKPKPAASGKTGTPEPVKTQVAKPKATPKKTVKAKPVKTTKPKPKPTVTTPPPTDAVSITGTSAQAGIYGTVQVRIEVVNGRMTSITPLRWPKGQTSIDISSYSIPLLIQEALQSQSANVTTISGASFTSRAFKNSLASAIAQAGI